MSVIENILETIDFKGISLNKFSQKIGVSNSYFTQIKKTKGSIGSDIILKIISEFSDINPEWLLTGKGSMLRGTEAVTKVSTCPELLAENKLLKDKIEKLEGNVDTLTWCMEEIRQKYRSKNMANHEEILAEQKPSN